MVKKITLSIFLLLLIHQTRSQCTGVDFEEQNGIAVIEIESENETGNWNFENSVSGFTGTGYFAFRGSSDYFNSPGNSVINYTLKVNNPGIYRVVWRNKIGTGTETTEHNDSWLRANDAFDFFARRNGVTKYPNGGSFKKSAQIVNGSSANNWMKVYSNTIAWNWTTETSDNEGLWPYVEFTSPGNYVIQVSGRSRGHFIDRLVLYDETEYTLAQATNLSRDETICGTLSTDNNIDSDNGLKIYPNPATTKITLSSTIAMDKVEIYDITGKVVKSQLLGKSVAEVSVSGLSRGVYLLSISSQRGKTNKKLVIN